MGDVGDHRRTQIDRLQTVYILQVSLEPARSPPSELPTVITTTAPRMNATLCRRVS